MSLKKKFKGLSSVQKLLLSAPPTPISPRAKKLPDKYIGKTMIIGDAPELNDYLPERSYHATFSSLESFARYTDELNQSAAWNTTGWDPGSSFSGTENMQECLTLAREGWKAGTERIEKVRSKIQSLRPMAPKNIKYGIAGAVPNVPRAVAGAILSMRNPDMAASRKRPVLTLISNMSCLGSVEQETMTNRAAAVAVLVDEIESRGFSCEVISTALSYGCNDPKFRMAHSVMLKNSNQPVDIYRLSFGLGHSSMFRRMVFADRGSQKIIEEKSGYGMGRSHGFEDFDQEFLKSKNVFTLPSANLCESKFENEDMASTIGIQYLIDDLRKQGCPALPKWTLEDIKRDKEPGVPDLW